VLGRCTRIKQVDNEFVTIVVISDGEPDSEVQALSVARTLKANINTVYVGRDGGSGIAFLKRLANTKGGSYHLNEFGEQLSKTVQFMLEG